MNDFEIFVLCLSGFYFLNCSSAKHSAYDSAGNTFDHDKDTLNEYRESVVELEKKMEDLEQQRWGLQNQVKNVHSLPKLVEDRARIEEMEKEVRRLKDVSNAIVVPTKLRSNKGTHVIFRKVDETNIAFSCFLHLFK